MSWLQEINFNEQGLVPAIAQNHANKEILMVAWVNKESLQLTLAKKQAVYWSRSRQQLWHKGETSGHFQNVHDIYLDCDSDVIILDVTQICDIACHTGRESCFYKKLVNNQWQTVTEVIKDPKEIYNNKTSLTSNTEVKEYEWTDTLTALNQILEQRKQASADSSYVASLYHKGINKILEKIGEEATECIIAAKDLQTAIHQDIENELMTNAKRTPKHEIIYEVADLWFHTMVMLSYFNIPAEEVFKELASRFGISGIEEKNSR